MKQQRSPCFRRHSRWLAMGALLAATPLAWTQGAPQAGNPLDTLPPQPARAAGEVQVQTQQPNPAPAVAATQQITPARFDIEGVRSIPFDAVAKLFTPLAGQRITVAALVERVAQASAQYQSAGYALSFFFVPAQDFAGGVVRIVAVEGHVAQVRIEGEPGRSRERIEAIAAHIQAEKPLTRATFERFTALLGQLPGFVINAQAAVPASTDGATTLTLTVKRNAAALSFGGEMGQPQSRVVLTGELNDLLTPGGQFSASTLLVPQGKEHYSALGYTQPVGSDGLVLKASASLYSAGPQAVAVGAATLARDIKNRRIDIAASYPLVLTAARSLLVSGGVYGVNNADTYTNPATGAYVSDDTRVRVGYAQLAFASNTPDVDRSASVQLAHGLDALGASAQYLSNVAGSPGPNPVKLAFMRVTMQATEVRRWPAQLTSVVSLALQYSPNALPSSEKLSFGGSRFARGYAPGEASGDSGWGLGFELNRRFAPFASSALRIEPYVLAEAAQVRAKLAAPVPAHLVSLTLGARVTDQKHYTVDLGLSRPLGDLPVENPERKLRASLLLSYRLGDS